MDRQDRDRKPLGPLDAVGLIVGIIVGAGIFKAPSGVFQAEFLNCQFAEFELLNFAGDRRGETLDELHVLRCLEVSQPVVAILANLLGFGAVAFSKFDASENFLAFSMAVPASSMHPIIQRK